MKYMFNTLGCKVNQYESQAMGEMLEQQGFLPAKENEQPDIVVVNSCTVTAESNRKTRQILRRFRKKFPECVIVLTGCMVQAFPEECKKIVEADLIVGNSEYHLFAKKILEFLEKRDRKIDIANHYTGENFTPLAVSSFNERTRAYIKIEDGCDRFCSYCIIPFARGRVRSKNIDDIKTEAIQLAKNGFKEVVLVGINLSAYGKDNDLELCDAVAAADVDGVERIRLGSLECDQLSDRTLDYLANNPKFCPQFHLSVQSGCDKTLKTMNRHYDTDFFRNLVSRIRAKFENCTITTDIMVGFSGETEQDFNQSAEFLKEIGFARSHVFCYSVRSGTAAEKFENRVLNAEKERRGKIMAEAAKLSERNFLKTQVGTVASVLFEETVDGYAVGYSKNYTKIKVKTDEMLDKKICNVEISQSFDDHCEGKILNA